MKKKLTLSINDDLIKFAHTFSQKTNQSISHIIEEYLFELKNIEDYQINEESFDNKIEKLYGAFQEQPIPDKKELRRAFHEKNND